MNMQINSFNSFRDYLLKVQFTDRSDIYQNDHFSEDSLIKIMYKLSDLLKDVKDEIIATRASVTIEGKDIFDANLNLLESKLNELELHKNYNIEKIDEYLKKFDTSKGTLFTWHDIIQNDNDLYVILDTHISWLDPINEPDVKLYPFLEKYNSYDVQTIHFIFLNYIKDHYIKDLLDFINEKKFRRPRNTNYLDTNWFKIGVSFAKGIPQKLKKENPEWSFNKITEKCGFNSNQRPYFSETLNNTTKSDKNIYQNQSKLKKIKEYCESNNIKMVNDFLEKISDD